ncbi:MAG: hypothetical protein JW809_09425 [Pirellulales bacterium]|nr:hypothetical protein [Pirellulales bacterium]
MIFDCHTHRFATVGPERRAEDDRWLQGLDAAGVTHCVVLPYAALCDARLMRTTGFIGLVLADLLQPGVTFS